MTTLPVTNALQERLSVRSPAQRGAAIAQTISEHQLAGEARAAAAVADKQARAAARNEKVHDSVKKVHESERAVLKEKRANLDANMHAHAQAREAHVSPRVTHRTH